MSPFQGTSDNPLSEENYATDIHLAVTETLRNISPLLPPTLLALTLPATPPSRFPSLVPSRSCLVEPGRRLILPLQRSFLAEMRLPRVIRNR